MPDIEPGIMDIKINEKHSPPQWCLESNVIAYFQTISWLNRRESFVLVMIVIMTMVIITMATINLYCLYYEHLAKELSYNSHNNSIIVLIRLMEKQRHRRRSNLCEVTRLRNNGTGNQAVWAKSCVLTQSWYYLKHGNILTVYGTRILLN